MRGMACRALAGLARSETVRQIISKLPLFTNGQLQSLMRDPILQEKRTEHVQFQKYALELMERVSGKTKSANQIDTSLANIHKANVVAQTKIQFNEQQLFELIHEHFLARGLTETAATLQREACLSAKVSHVVKPTSHHSPFSFRSPLGTVVSRARMRVKPSDFNATLNAIEPVPSTSSVSATPSNSTETTNNNNHVHKFSEPEEPVVVNGTIPLIKLIRKNHPNSSPHSNNAQQQQQQQQQRSLQKQVCFSTTIYCAIEHRVAN